MHTTTCFRKSLFLTFLLLSSFSLFAQNQALDLSGAGNEVNVTYNLNTATGFTVEQWIQIPSMSTTTPLVNQTSTNVAAPLDVYVNTDGSISTWMGDGGSSNQSTSAPGLISQGVWHHVAISYNQGLTQALIFVDGVSTPVDTLDLASPVGNVGPVRIGRRADLNEGDDLYVDEVRIWNTNRSGTQINNDYNAKLHGGETNLEVYLQFEGNLLDDALNNGSQDGSIGAGSIGYVNGAPLQNNALNFDGTDDRVVLPRNSLPTGLTFEAWVNTVSGDAASGYAGNAALSVIGDVNNNIRGSFGINGGEVWYLHWTGTLTDFDTIKSVQTVNDGNWHHIAVTHDQGSNEVRIYVDGQLDGQGFTTTYHTNMSFNRIGSSYVATVDGDFFDGSIDEVRVWDNVRTQEQINADAYFTLSAGSGLIASYDFNQGVANGDNGSYTTLPDLTVNGNDGTLNGPFALNFAASNWVPSAAFANDIFPPIFLSGYPLIDNIDTTGFDITVQLNEPGTYFYVVVPDGATPPSVDDVRGGTGFGGTGQVAAGNIAVTTPATDFVLSPAGLTPNTFYDVYIVAQDDEGSPNPQNANTVFDVTTEAGFVTRWVTSDGQITIPTTGGGYNYSVEWNNITNAGINEGFIDGRTGDYTITGMENGSTYEVIIRGAFPRIYFNNTGDKDKIQSIEQWGNISWTFFQSAFYGCTNVTYNATDAPDLTGVSGLGSMFRNASSFNATDLTSWDVSGINDMGLMFSGATAFAGDVSSWDVSNVVTMTELFRDLPSFNSDISGWVTTSASNMLGMFQGSSSFNRDLSGWDLNGVGNTSFMFFNASSFDQDLSLWDVTTISNMTNMLSNTATSVANYDAILNGWASQSASLQVGVTLGVTGLGYSSAGAPGRDTLTTAPSSWTILGDQLVTPAAPTNLIAYATSSTEITLEWIDNATNETSYLIERADDYAFTTNVMTVLAAEPADTDSVGFAIGVNQPYYYRVTPVNGFEDASSQSSIEFATTENFTGHALTFDGTGDQVTFNDSQLPTATNPRAVEMWVRTNTSDINRYFFSYGTSSNGQGFALGVSSTGTLIFTQTGSNVQSGGIINDNNWHHVAVSYNGSTYQLYIDGSLDGSNSLATNTILSGTAQFGSNIVGSNGMIGELDEVKFWSFAKTDFSDRFTPLQGDEGGLVAYYPFDENTGVLSTVVDRSQNTNDGTMVGDTDFTPSTVVQDGVVSNTNDSGPGSLRAAINYANANSPSTITFNIPGGGPHTIGVTATLPDITASGTIIDGTSQPGWIFGDVNNMVSIDGSGIGSNSSGLNINEAADVEIYGLIITGFSGLESHAAIELTGDGADNAIIGSPGMGNIIHGGGTTGIYITHSDSTIIRGNWIGTLNGTTPSGNNHHGISASGAVDNLTIGGNSLSGEGNIISGAGNGRYGITTNITGTNLSIKGNLIGTDSTGNASINNEAGGVDVGGAVTFVVGGFSPGEMNIISGNNTDTNADGINVGNGPSGSILNNYIGVGADGITPLGNGGYGILFANSASNVLVDGNTISDNGTDGLYLGNGSDSLTVSNNIIGLTPDGLDTLGNTNDGIRITNGTNITISGNTISANGSDGIAINGDQTNLDISTNVIGLDFNGQGDMVLLGDGVTVSTNNKFGNLANGIVLNLVDGASSGNSITGNLISGNGVFADENTGAVGIGIYINADTRGFTIQDNVIGLEGDEVTPQKNINSGIYISGLSNSVIGGTGANEANLIGHNGDYGIEKLGTNMNGIPVFANEFVCNEKGGISFTSTPDIDAPVITSINSTTISGTTTAEDNSNISIYEADSCGVDQGKQLVLNASNSVSGGNWSATGTFDVGKNYVAVVVDDETAINATLSISEFSTAQAITPPPAPTNLIGYATSATEITLEWTDNALNESGYLIERADDYAFTLNVVTVLASEPIDTDSVNFTIGVDQPYFYRVTAINGAEDASSQSSIEFATTEAFGGRAVSLDGTNDYVVSDSNLGLTGTASRTIEFWYQNGSNTGNTHPISYGGLSTNSAFGVYLNNDDLYFFAEVNDYNTGYTFSDNDWHHIAVTYDGSFARTYVDGAETPTSSVAKTLGTFDGQLAIGTKPALTGFSNSLIDEVKVWNFAKSDFSDRYSPANGDEAGLLLYYSFDENTGTRVVDKSQNTNDGTFINGPTFAASNISDGVVYNTNDSGPGSLREAINYANLNSGTTITFDISGGSPWEINLVSDLPTITAQGTVIDGSTQPGWNLATGDVPQISGGGSASIGLNASNNFFEVYGLHIRDFTVSGIRFNTTGTAANGYQIGGPFYGNIITNCGTSGINIISYTGGGSIQGNFIGLMPNGTTIGSNTNGISLGTNADNVLIGGPGSGEGNVISNSATSEITLSSADSVIIRNNIIGLTPDESTAAAGGANGINLNGADGSTIEDNVIAAHTSGVRLNNASGHTIRRNFIGVSSDGTTPFPNTNGIHMINNLNSDNNIIGSNTNTGDGNVIAENTSNAILIEGSGNNGNQIQRNSIFNNAAGITLGSGAHNGILPPGIDPIAVGSTVTGTGTNGDEIDLYYDDSNGQGNVYLGSATVSGGTWSIGSLGLINGDQVVATATNATDGTSGFSTAASYTFNYPVAEGAGQALSLDGTDDLVVITNDPSFENPTYTLETWVSITSNPGNGDTDAFINMGTLDGSLDGNGYTMGYTYDGANYQVFLGHVNGSNTVQPLVVNYTLNLGEWYHVAGVYDGTDMILYVNGEEIGRTTADAPDYIGDATDIRLGGYHSVGGVSAGDFLNAQLDEIQIWDFAKNEGEIRVGLAQKIIGNPSGLVGYYRMDDSGDTGNLLDYQGVHNGVISGGATYGLSGAHLGDYSTFEYSYTAGSGRNLDVFRVENLGVANLPLHIYRVSGTPANNVVSGFDNIADTAYYGVFSPGQTYDVVDSIGSLTADRRMLYRADGADTTWTSISGVLGIRLEDDQIYAYGQSGSGQFVTAIDQNPYPTPVDAGFAMSFDGTADYITVPHSPSIDFSGNFTVEAWINPDGSATPQGIVSKFNNEMVLWLDGSTLRYEIGGGLQANCGTIPSGEWTHVALTYDGVNASVFVNGVQVFTNPEAQPATSTRNLFIGSWDQNEFTTRNFVGDIDEVRIWDIALGQTNIRDHMIQKIDADFDSLNHLVAYYRFDENSSATAANLAGDSDGTITGATPVISGAPQGQGSIYSYDGTPGILNTAQFGEDINVYYDDATGGIHGYVVQGNPNQLQAAGFNNLDQGKYYGVFAPSGQKVDIHMDYNTGNDTNRRIVYRKDALDTAAVGGWERLSGLLNAPDYVDSVYAFNVPAGEVTTAVLNPPSSYPVLGSTDAGDALSFDGVDGYVDVSHDSDLSIATSVTIEAWVRRTRLDDVDVILEKGGDWTNGQTNYGIGLNNNANGNMFFFTWNGGGRGTNGVTDFDWHHYAAVAREGDTDPKLYIDGVLQTIDNTFGNATIDLDETTTKNLHLGAQVDPGLDYFSANEIDEVRIWRDTLSAATLNTYANINSVLFHPNYTELVAYYRFDDGSGSTILEDVFANHDGTLTNMDENTDWVPGPTLDPGNPLGENFNSDLPTTTDQILFLGSGLWEGQGVKSAEDSTKANGGFGDAAFMFFGTGNYLTTPTLDGVNQFTFYYRAENPGGSGFVFDVFTSSDGGISFDQEIASDSSNNTTTYKEFNYNFGSPYTGPIRIVYDALGSESGLIDDFFADVPVIRPEVTITTLPVGDTTVNVGEQDVLVYKVRADIANAAAAAEGLYLTILGADSSDFELDGFKFYENVGLDDFGSATLIDSSSWSPGGPVPNGSIGQLFNNFYTPGTSTYYYVTADISASANPGTFNVGIPDIEQFGFADSDKIDGGLTISDSITIQAAPLPDATLTTINVPSTSLTAGSTDNLVYQFSVSASGGTITKQGFSFGLGGDAVNADFAVNGWSLYESINTDVPDPLTGTLIDTTNIGDFIVDSVAFLLSGDILDGNTHYFYVLVDIDASATVNNTFNIGLSAPDPLESFGIADPKNKVDGGFVNGEMFTIQSSDVTSPTPLISSSESSPTNANPIPIAIDFGELVVGFDSTDLAVGNGTAQNFMDVDGQNYTFDIVPTADGVVTVDLADSVAQDLAGNENLVATQFTIDYDGTGPSITFDQDGQTTNDTNLTGTTSDASDVMLLSLDGGSTLTGVTVNGDATWTYDLSTDPNYIGDGGYSVYLASSDTLGNQTVSAGGTVTIDQAAPVVEVDIYGTSITSPQITGIIDDLSATIEVTVNGETNPATNVGDGTWSLAAGILTDLADGTYDVQVSATDLAGNVGTDQTSDELVISQDIFALVATQITPTSFRANWSEGLDVQSYELDVSTVSDFSTFLPGFESLSVPNTSRFAIVTGLDFSTNYYYRVRLVNTASQVSANSNTRVAKTTVGLATLADSLALVQIHDAIQPQGLNWGTERLRNWDGVTLGSDRTRVEIVNISGTQSIGDMPNPFVGDAFTNGGLSNLTGMDVSDNQITGLMDFSSTSISTLFVNDNSLQFDDLEPVVGITTLDYANQASVQYNETTDGSPIEVRYTSDYLLSIGVNGTGIGGSANTYSWFRNEAAISSNTDFAITNAEGVILDIDYDNMGVFRTEVTSSLVPGLVIDVDSQTVWAIADMEVSVADIDGNPLSAPFNAYMLETTRIATGFRVLETLENQTSSTFTFPDVVLGDYITFVESDLELYIPTYFGNVFEWTEADTLFFRSDDVISMIMTEVPRELTAADGNGSLDVLIEEDFEEEGGRIDARRRAAKRKCGLRRKRSGGRIGQDDDDFELIAYGETDDNGEFQFGFLPQGTYRFFVEYPGIPLDESSFVEFEVGEEGVSD
ncbi:LamG-like jellyroll fold domain-containing protein, partial [Ekhidna sp.]